jgi:hypothetical protein
MGQLNKQENTAIISTDAIMWRNNANFQVFTVGGRKKTWRCWDGWKFME